MLTEFAPRERVVLRESLRAVTGPLRCCSQGLAFPVGVSTMLVLSAHNTYSCNCFLFLSFLVQYVFILHRPYISNSIILESSCSAVIQVHGQVFRYYGRKQDFLQNVF